MELPDEVVRRTRAVANGLDRSQRTAGPAGVAEVVRRTGGLQAQTWLGAALQVRARSTGTGGEDVRVAREQDRSVVRGWYQRGTLHLVAAEDASLLLTLLGEVLETRTERRYRELGLDAGTRHKAADHLVRKLTRHGPMTRAELRESLQDKGLPAEHVYHLLWHAGVAGKVCYGPFRDGAETWVTTADWLGKQREHEPEKAMHELAGRYLAAYGPATPKDLATWSGLPVPTARKAFATRDDLVDVVVRGKPAAALRSQRYREDPVDLRLLGEFDTYLLGHADRTLILDERYRKRINAGGGLLKPAIAQDGVITGTWRFDRKTGPKDLETFDASPLDVTDELADIERFHALASI